MSRSTYDKYPYVPVALSHRACVSGWDAIAARLQLAVSERDATKTVLIIECYAGVHEDEILEALTRRLDVTLGLRAREALLAPSRIDELVAPFLGDDPVFGRMNDLSLVALFDEQLLAVLARRAVAVESGLVVIVGTGATLIAEPDIVVYADLSRWEAQGRFRLCETGNLGTDNRAAPAASKYKRAFFVDWRACDRKKRELWPRCDFVLDTHHADAPKLVEAASLRSALAAVARRPFRVVPFFDPAPWGGQWMKEVCDLDRTAPNFGWCFDCVPEENSLLLGFGDARFEIPALDLVFAEPFALLGEEVCARFGAEFPIRFDFLDTMGGGHLSFQVHPTVEYIGRTFGMPYTQDESYYILDAGPDATVLLGLRTGIDPAAMLRDLEAAQSTGAPFPIERYANRWPARKHDHFLIPAGTVHCSGANTMVLEISATPYIFTFKLWDWDRPGLDGRPRPIHLQHGSQVIGWERDTAWTQRELINRVTLVEQGPDFREERTGLHETEFIETRRHWFQGPVWHHTRGTVQVLNLVEGKEAVVESPDRAFEPFVVHYAETFIVPASVGPYVIRPAGHAERPLATIKAYVRSRAATQPSGPMNP